MEYCDGFEIGVLGRDNTTVLEPYKKEISRKITKLYSDMIFLQGYVHCDPHPGKVFVIFRFVLKETLRILNV